MGEPAGTKSSRVAPSPGRQQKPQSDAASRNMANIEHKRSRQGICLGFYSQSYEKAFGRYQRHRDASSFRHSLIVAAASSLIIAVYEVAALQSLWMPGGRVAMLAASLAFLAVGARCHMFVPSCFHAPIIAFLAIETILIYYQWEMSLLHYSESAATARQYDAFLGGHTTYWATTTGYWSMLTLHNSGLRFYWSNIIAALRLLLLVAMPLLNMWALEGRAMPEQRWEYWALILSVLGIGNAKLYFQERSQRSEFIQLRRLVGDSQRRDRLSKSSETLLLLKRAGPSISCRVRRLRHKGRRASISHQIHLFFFAVLPQNIAAALQENAMVTRPVSMPVREVAAGSPRSEDAVHASQGLLPRRSESSRASYRVEASIEDDSAKAPKNLPAVPHQPGVNEAHHDSAASSPGADERSEIGIRSGSNSPLPSAAAMRGYHHSIDVAGQGLGAPRRDLQRHGSYVSFLAPVRNASVQSISASEAKLNTAAAAGNASSLDTKVKQIHFQRIGAEGRHGLRADVGMHQQHSAPDLFTRFGSSRLLPSHSRSSWKMHKLFDAERTSSENGSLLDTSGEGSSRSYRIRRKASTRDGSSRRSKPPSKRLEKKISSRSLPASYGQQSGRNASRQHVAGLESSRWADRESPDHTGVASTRVSSPASHDLQAAHHYLLAAGGSTGPTIRARDRGYSREVLSSESPLTSYAGGPTATATQFGLETPIAYQHESVAIMFIHIVNLKDIVAGRDGVLLVQELNRLLVEVDRIVDDNRAYKIMAIADMYMCVAGDSIATTTKLPGENHVLQLCKAALRVMQMVNTGEFQVEGVPLLLKIGINCGPVASGVIGRKTLNYHVFGDAVNVASRMCSTSEPGCIQLSSDAAQYLHQHGGWHRLLLDRGEIMVKGKGLMQTYWLPSDIAGQEFSSKTAKTPFAAGAVSVSSDGSSAIPSVSPSAANRRKGRQSRHVSERGSITQLEGFLREYARIQATPLAFGTLTFAPTFYQQNKQHEEALKAEGVLPDQSMNSRHQGRTGRDENFASAVGAFEVESQYTHYKARKYRDEVLRSTLLHFIASVVILFVYHMASDAGPEAEDLHQQRVASGSQIVAGVVLAISTAALFGYRRSESQGCHGSGRPAGAQGSSRRADRRVSPKLASRGSNKRLRRSQCEFCCGSPRFMGQRGPQGILESPSTVISIVATLLALVATAVMHVAGSVDVILEAVLAVHVVVLVARYRGLLGSTMAFTASCIGVAASITNGDMRQISLVAIVLFTSSTAVTTQCYEAEIQTRQKFITQLNALELSSNCQALLRNMLPSGYHVERLMRGDDVVEQLDNVVMLYSDIVGFTTLAAKLQPHQLITLLHDLYEGFDNKLEKSSSSLYKMETIGDAFIVLGGLRASSEADRSRTTAERKRRESSITASMDRFKQSVYLGSSVLARGAVVQRGGQQDSIAAGQSHDASRDTASGISTNGASSSADTHKVPTAALQATEVPQEEADAESAAGSLGPSTYPSSGSLISSQQSFLVDRHSSFRTQFRMAGEQLGMPGSMMHAMQPPSAAVSRIEDDEPVYVVCVGPGESNALELAPIQAGGHGEGRLDEQAKGRRNESISQTGGTAMGRVAEHDEQASGEGANRDKEPVEVQQQRPRTAPASGRAALARHARAVAKFATDMLAVIAGIRVKYDLPEFDMRIGIHVGPAVGGILGESRPRYFVWGEHTTRTEALESRCPPGQILVSDAAARLIECASTSGAAFDNETVVTVGSHSMVAHQLRRVGSREVEREPVDIPEMGSSPEPDAGPVQLPRVSPLQA